MRYLHIPQDAEKPMTIVNGPDDDLLALFQGAVGGYIERVRIGDYQLQTGFPNVIMLVDEEGLLKRKKVNVRASYFYGQPLHGQVITGDAVIVGEGYVGGEIDFMDLPFNWTVNTADDYLSNHDSGTLLDR